MCYPEMLTKLGVWLIKQEKENVLVNLNKKINLISVIKVKEPRAQPNE